MKNKFKENLVISDEEIKELFASALIVLDTNVLINLYRYSDQGRELFFEILEKLKDRLYLPYQIGKEFFQNRLDEILTQRELYNSAIASISKLKNEFQNSNRNPFLSEEKLKYLDEIEEELNTKSAEFEEIRKDDTILSKILELFSDCIGEEPEQEHLDYIYKTGLKRYKEKRPPGYQDDMKPEDSRKYGDYIIWHDLMETAKRLERHCLFITDDRKEDWWLMDKNKKIIMPRPELRKEFTENSGMIYYSYLPKNFLDKIKNYLHFEVEKSLLEEVEDTSDKNYYKNYNKPINIDELFEYSSLSNKRIYLVQELVPNAILNFLNSIENLGYECSVDKISSTLFTITTVLPNIFDIDRKFELSINELAKFHEIKLIKKVT